MKQLKILVKQMLEFGILAGFKLHIQEQKLWKYKGPRIAKTIFKKKNKFRAIKPPNFKICYMALVNKTK